MRDVCFVLFIIGCIFYMSIENIYIYICIKMYFGYCNH